MRGPLILTILALAAPLSAQEVRVYQCTGADGDITMQTSGPCPPGAAQRVRVVDVPPPLTLRAPHVQDRSAPSPVPVIPVVPVAVAAAGGGDAAGDAAATPPGPPPPLFLCTRHDQGRYFHDDEEPEQTCRPLNVVGIGGLAGIGAGQACERVRDTCEPVADDTLCRAWDARVREAEFRWKFAGANREADTLRADYERLARTLDESSCTLAH